MRTKEQAVAAFNGLTTQEVADRLRVSRDHVVGLIRDGALPATDVARGSRPEYRIDESDLAEFIEQRRVA